MKETTMSTPVAICDINEELAQVFESKMTLPTEPISTGSEIHSVAVVETEKEKEEETVTFSSKACHEEPMVSQRNDVESSTADVDNKLSEGCSEPSQQNREENAITRSDSLDLAEKERLCFQALEEEVKSFTFTEDSMDRHSKEVFKQYSETQDMQTRRRMEQTASAAEGAEEVVEPLKMMKKGAVAALGGTLVGVGLVMIPLPTPFGAAVASSGLAVLGTEFEQAKELNEKLVDGAKEHLETARGKIVQSIESMEDDGMEDEESEHSEEDDSMVPGWLHMNPAERKRQIRLMKDKYRRENQSKYEQMKESMTKSTGSFLSKNLLPYLKPKSEDDESQKLGEGKKDSMNFGNSWSSFTSYFRRPSDIPKDTADKAKDTECQQEIEDDEYSIMSSEPIAVEPVTSDLVNKTDMIESEGEKIRDSYVDSSIVKKEKFVLNEMGTMTLDTPAPKIVAR